MKYRYDILKLIDSEQPIGRRVLAQKFGTTERILRKDIEGLRDQRLVQFTAKGIMLTDIGRETLIFFQHNIDMIVNMTAYSDQIKSQYDISGCYVVQGDVDQDFAIDEEMSRLMGQRLLGEMSDGDIITVTGGTTMASIAKYLEPTPLNVTFVPARGGLGEDMSMQANSIVAKMAEKTNSHHEVLYVPDEVSEEGYNALTSERRVQNVLNKIQNANIVIHGVGQAKVMASRRQSDDDIYQLLDDHQAVGEAFGYYFNMDGEVVHRIRTIGLKFEDLKDKQSIYAVAGGTSKKEAIKAYLNIAPKNTTLITDEAVAKFLVSDE